MENRRQRKRPRRSPWDYVIFGFLGFVILVLCVWIAVGITNEYTIELQVNGSAEVTLEYGTEYRDAGAQAQCWGSHKNKEPFELEVQTQSDLDTSKVGTYRITYTASYQRQTKKVERIVHVVDTQMPVISLVSDPDHYTLPGQVYEEEGFSAMDGHDGDITHKVQRELTDTEVIYTVTDASGNTAELRRPIVYKDPEAPVLTLLGDMEITIEAGTSYAEPGFTAVDNCDGEIAHLVNISGNVNIWSAGSYVITYTVTDSYGNVSTATRTVNVKAKQTGGGDVGGTQVDGTGKVIYLTFDDGPSSYTLELLQVLFIAQVLFCHQADSLPNLFDIVLQV